MHDRNAPLPPRTVLILHAVRLDYKHDFIEVFTSYAELERYMSAHAEAYLQEVTLHELDPV